MSTYIVKIHQKHIKGKLVLRFIFHAYIQTKVSIQLLEHKKIVMKIKDKLCKLKKNVRILKRIPKGARIAVANKLSEAIQDCVQLNDLKAWQKLMVFCYYALRIPKVIKIFSIGSKETAKQF